MENSSVFGNKKLMKETFFCDFKNELIQNRADELRRGKNDYLELAKEIFEYVRDEIKFGFDEYQIKASDTLQKGYGMCSHKALLMVAILRYLQIPSRLAFIPIKRKFLKASWGLWYLTMAKKLNHVIAEIFLNNKWIAIDLTLDINSYQKLYLPSGVTWSINWNGIDDCLLFKENLSGSIKPYSDIDGALRSNADNPLPPRFVLIPFLKFINKKMWRKCSDR